VGGDPQGPQGSPPHPAGLRGGREDTLIPAGPARPQDIDPELATIMANANANANPPRTLFIRELMTTNWAETYTVHIYSPNDIRTIPTFNPNGRGIMFTRIYHSSQDIPREFVSYSFTPPLQYCRAGENGDLI
jgi:hypothetical protein